MIREYAEEDHPAGFIGIRVSVNVGGSHKLILADKKVKIVRKNKCILIN